DLEVRQRVQILGELAFHSATRGDTRSGSRYADEALALAEELGEPQLVSLGRFAVAIASFLHTARIRHELLDAAIGDAHRAVAPNLRSTLAFQLGRTDRRDEARGMWRDLIAEAVEREEPVIGWRLFQLAQVEANAGAWDEALRLCEEATDV